MFSQALNKWSKHILMATPLLFLLPMTYMANKPGICLYVMLWMVVYWVSAVIPLPVTSLMPLVLFPLLGILSAEETATAYFDEVGATIFASLVFGAALESTGLATRVALQMLSVVGTSFSSLLFVFMVGSALLSMVFSNAATTAIVAPVVAALVEQMKCHVKLKRNLVPTSAAASLMASTPRVRVAEAYRKAEERLRASLVGYDKAEQSKTTQGKTQREVDRRNKELGRIRADEFAVLMLLLLLVYLWSFKSRDSNFSWTKLLPVDATCSSSTTFVLVVIPLFAIPRCRQHSVSHDVFLRPHDTILSWPEVSTRCHWNIMLLVSGSLTFSKASKAVKLKMHPMSLAFPVTLSSSFGFMLPASTSPNAIVYDMARMGVRDMVRPGFVLALICLTATILLSVTWGQFVLKLQEFPEWATDNETIADIE
ncbi:hypothetical protein HPB51_003345 [Rhipicephalus microplus]|uniref:Citrate transporter-like domain-containing protein n=1 Tax=Rhipicephalus microplus TaxID=6941 RepID=A0A9J6EWU1_RHIMP|nr:hypothetical protein HPB51_003345 [Rhipicephalus microplus]